MKRVFFVALVVACFSIAAFKLHAQANAPSQNQQPPSHPAPAADAPKPKPQQDANPFPEDTTSVPVMPNANSPGSAPLPEAEDYATIPLPSADSDPVRSPDEADSPSGSGGSSSSSSSNEGLDQLLKPPPESEKANKHRKGDDAGADVPPPEGPKVDEEIGSYYLDQKNWKAALSRFESALVLDPENPDVYWGLAESERHLGNYASAKAHYLRLLDYDPENKHAKETRRILKEPELANAKAVSSNAPATKPQQ
jgi:tetratricopeptide (TPR) repeat protein